MSYRKWENLPSFTTRSTRKNLYPLYAHGPQADKNASGGFILVFDAPLDPENCEPEFVPSVAQLVWYLDMIEYVCVEEPLGHQGIATELLRIACALAGVSGLRPGRILPDGRAWLAALGFSEAHLNENRPVFAPPAS